VAAYEELVAAVCAQASIPEADLIVMYSPAGKAREVETWLREIAPGVAFTLRAQSEGDLGERLTAAFEQAFANEYQQVAAIGSDCVELTSETFHETWRRLTMHDVVLGPASDGGYYLIALSKPEPRLFAGVHWSTDTVLAETLTAAAASALSVYRLPELNDVDTEDDWHRARARLRR